MTATIVNTVKSTLEPSDHPYMQGSWTPSYNEYDATDMLVIGTIPTDIDGVYIRNTENQVHDPIGRYHPFDGDGMLHMMSFKNGVAEYRSRFIRTKGFKAEQEAGKSLWAGLMEPPHKSTRPGFGAQEWLKDSSSTDVVVHAGKVLTTFYQCGDGYRLDADTLEQLGTESWVPLDGISAHPKVDEATGEMMFFNYSKHAPYLHYGVVGADNKLKHYIPVETPGPRLPHDMAFSKNYSILNDMPLFWDADLLERGIHAARFHPDLPTRFAIVPRYGEAADIKWFEAKPTYTLHWLNAYEEGDEIILDGYFQDEPQPEPLADAPKGYAQMMAYVDQHSFQSKLHRWRFNLKSGETTEERLDDRVLEFGMFNQQYAGRKYRYVYSAVPEPGWFLFSGLVKHDLETGTSQQIEFGDQRFGSETPFVPRVNAKDEDDGYLVSFINDLNEDRTECVLIDAKDFEAGPVCRIILPERICSGTHATWASRKNISNDIRAAQAA